MHTAMEARRMALTIQLGYELPQKLDKTSQVEALKIVYRVLDGFRDSGLQFSRSSRYCTTDVKESVLTIVLDVQVTNDLDTEHFPKTLETRLKRHLNGYRYHTVELS